MKRKRKWPVTRCGRKVRHETRDKAVQVRQMVIAKGATEVERLNVYYCFRCAGWHLGKSKLHKPENDRQE